MLASDINIPRNSVNINTNITISMQQQLHFTPDKLLQLYRAKWLLYIPSAVIWIQSEISTLTVANFWYQQHNANGYVCCLEFVLKDQFNQLIWKGLWSRQDSSVFAGRGGNTCDTSNTICANPLQNNITLSQIVEAAGWADNMQFHTGESWKEQ